MTTSHIVSSGFDPLQKEHIENIKASHEPSDGVKIRTTMEDMIEKVHDKKALRIRGNALIVKEIAREQFSRR
jgi:hypothetical protein